MGSVPAVCAGHLPSPPGNLVCNHQAPRCRRKGRTGRADSPPVPAPQSLLEAHQGAQAFGDHLLAIGDVRGNVPHHGAPLADAEDEDGQGVPSHEGSDESEQHHAEVEQRRVLPAPLAHVPHLSLRPNEEASAAYGDDVADRVEHSKPGDVAGPPKQRPHEAKYDACQKTPSAPVQPLPEGEIRAHGIGTGHARCRAQPVRDSRAH
mmetsp:Transcript_25793/g.83304  ORF Transcript_25793/g.83304 Transcript_25793/m.83304 type:complete len:206 (-) Transcript_25793:254-871(-)